MNVCKACDGTGRAGTYTHHKCYRCAGTGKTRKKIARRHRK